jgi:hypothetical protein
MRSKMRIPIRVPVQSAPWGLSTCRINTSAAGLGRIAFLLVALLAERGNARETQGAWLSERETDAIC